MAAAERSDVPELSAGDAASGTSAEIAAPAPDADVLVLPTAETHDLVLCCRRCRQPLLRPANLTDHDRGRQAFSYRRQAKEREQHGGADDAGAAAAACTSYFLDEPLQWMKDASADVEGKLNCPKCGTRVGVLKWAGAQCSCGTWVNPALQVYKKAVDERYFPR